MEMEFTSFLTGNGMRGGSKWVSGMGMANTHFTTGITTRETGKTVNFLAYDLGQRHGNGTYYFFGTDERYKG